MAACLDGSPEYEDPPFVELAEDRLLQVQDLRPHLRVFQLIIIHLCDGLAQPKAQGRVHLDFLSQRVCEKTTCGCILTLARGFAETVIGVMCWCHFRHAACFSSSMERITIFVSCLACSPSSAGCGANICLNILSDAVQRAEVPCLCQEPSRTNVC